MDHWGRIISMSLVIALFLKTGMTGFTAAISMQG
jgi:hypothetical protein